MAKSLTIDTMSWLAPPTIDERRASNMAQMFQRKSIGWGARIRTWECRYQKPVPYRLATPQQPI